MLTFEKKENYLLISSIGVRNNFLEVINGTNEIFKIIEQTKAKAVLFDYRQTEFNIPQTDALNLVRHYETKAPWLQQLKLAAVVNNRNTAIAHLWSELSQTRGFNIRVFDSLDEATRWLTS